MRTFYQVIKAFRSNPPVAVGDVVDGTDWRNVKFLLSGGYIVLALASQNPDKAFFEAQAAVELARLAADTAIEAAGAAEERLRLAVEALEAATLEQVAAQTQAETAEKAAEGALAQLAEAEAALRELAAKPVAEETDAKLPPVKPEVAGATVVSDKEAEGEPADERAGEAALLPADFPFGVALAEAGFSTIESLQGVSKGRLSVIKGVGPVNAQIILDALAKLVFVEGPVVGDKLAEGETADERAGEAALLPAG